MAEIIHAHTSLETFETCPRLYKARYIDHELKFESSPATEFGLAMHSAIEYYQNTGRDPDVSMLPKTYKDGEAHYKKLRSNVTTLGTLSPNDVFVERKLGITKDGAACDYWSRDAYFRGAIDLLALWTTTALLADYKTGKKVESSMQTRRSALLVFAAFPRIEAVHTAYWHSDPAIVDDPLKVYTRADIPAIRAEIDGIVAKVEIARTLSDWHKQPSGLCLASKRNPSYKGCRVSTCCESQAYLEDDIPF